MKKTFILPIILVLSAITVFSTGFSIKTELQNRRYRLELENSYSRSLDDFNASINNIALTLDKARFVTTPKQLSSLAAKLLTEAELSKTALSQLPAAEELTVLNRFLSHKPVQPGPALCGTPVFAFSRACCGRIAGYVAEYTLQRGPPEWQAPVCGTCCPGRLSACRIDPHAGA